VQPSYVPCFSDVALRNLLQTMNGDFHWKPVFINPARQVDRLHELGERVVKLGDRGSDSGSEFAGHGDTTSFHLGAAELCIRSAC
jgi:hypothetical protein